MTGQEIDHPAHYGGDSAYEAVKIIEAHRLGFHLGNVIKYVIRARHKGTPEADLRKALWYLTRHVEIEYGEESPAEIVEALWRARHKGTPGSEKPEDPVSRIIRERRPVIDESLARGTTPDLRRDQGGT